MDTNKICIIVLNWNNAKDTIECLSSLQKITYPNFTILVVDNGSTDTSIECISQAFPHIPILKNGTNLGFAEGNNRGILHAIEKGAEAFLILNNDTIVHPDILHAFHDAATQYPKAGVFGAKIFYFDDPAKVWYAGGDVDLNCYVCVHSGSDTQKIEETNYACGCALFIKKEVIKKVGLMDPRFFLLWEEIDWCWRIRKAGYQCLFVPQAKVWHKISSSFEGGYRGDSWNYYYFRNRLLFLKLHFPFTSRFKTSIKEILFIKGAKLQGVRDYFLGRFGKKP